MPEPTPIDWIEPSEDPRHAHPAAAVWRAHVEAARIGQRLPVDPEIAANRERTEALLVKPRGNVW